jgi:ABC-type amino acid transport system permease subunit
MSDFDFGVIVRALPFLWEGMQLTLALTALAMMGGILIGTGLALLRLWRQCRFRSSLPDTLISCAQFHSSWLCFGSIFLCRWRSGGRLALLPRP